MTMFIPIIHNLQPDDAGYDAAQHYNTLIGNRPKCNGSLSSKVIKQAQWKLDCIAALDAVKLIMEGK